MSVDTTELRKLAEQANAVTTGNHWIADTGGTVLDPDREGNSRDGTIVCETVSGEGLHRKWLLRDFIAAADPSTVLALLDRIDALEADRTDSAKGRIARVLDAHQPRQASWSTDPKHKVCSCNVMYPCVTVRILTEGAPE